MNRLFRSLILGWLSLWLLACAPSSSLTTAAPDEESERYRQVVFALSAPEMQGRGAGGAGLENARDYLQQEFQHLGLQPTASGYLQDFQARFDVPPSSPPAHYSPSPVAESRIPELSTVRLSNVIGVIPGWGRLTREVVVLGAHYDHVGLGDFKSAQPDGRGKLHPGADDNASGVAGLLLIAQRQLERIRAGKLLPVSEPTAAHSPPDRRTLLLIAFSGEERGNLGSRHFLAQLPELGIRQDRIRAMINLDMIGRLRPPTLNVFGVDTDPRWAELLQRAMDDSGLTLRSRGPGTGPSDQAPFAQAGLPVLHFFTGVHEDYHRPSDTPDRIDPVQAMRVVRIVDRLLEDLLTQPGSSR